MVRSFAALDYMVTPTFSFTFNNNKMTSNPAKHIPTTKAHQPTTLSTYPGFQKYGIQPPGVIKTRVGKTCNRDDHGVYAPVSPRLVHSVRPRRLALCRTLWVSPIYSHTPIHTKPNQTTTAQLNPAIPSLRVPS